MALGAQYLKGVVTSAAGMVIISPDALLLRLVEDAGTWDVAFYRLLFQGLSLLAYLLVTLRGAVLPRFRGMGTLGLLSSLILAGAQTSFVVAITHTSAANTLILLATMPLFGALLGWLMLRERVPARTLAAIALASIGVLIVFSNSLGQGYWVGDPVALVAAMLYAANLVILRKTGEAIMVPALCLSGFIGSLIAVPFADPAAISLRDVGIIAWLGLVQLPLALVLFFKGTQYVPAAEVALLSLIETVLGPFLTWLGVGEEPSGAAFIGGGLVLLAITSNSFLALRRSADVR